MVQPTVGEFERPIAGEVILPDNPEYSRARNVLSRMGSPAAIVRVKDTGDIVAAIRFARDNHLNLSVRSGGHHASGLSTNDGGVVIDLSHFNNVEVLDASRRIVRIGAGARWGDAAQALAASGLAISSGDTSTVGVGGLTLGGGMGWMVRKYGLTIDNIEGAELVTADGRILRVNAAEHPDLFWAIRGGGGNFGVITSFDFRAQPVTSVVGGMVTYDIAEMTPVLTIWAAYMRSAPEELTTMLVIFPGFGPEPTPQLMLLLCYVGDDEAAADAVVQPLLKIGTPLHEDVKRMPYHKMLEEPMEFPGVKPISDNGFIKTLDEEAIAAIAANYGRQGTPVLQLRSLGGAMGRVEPEATAFAHREYEAFVLAASIVPIDTPAEQANQIREDAWRPLKPFTSGAYINFQSDVSAESTAIAYPPATYARLARVKAVYDPDNVFNQNHNIKPS